MHLEHATGYELVSLVSTFLLSERDHRSVIPQVFEMLLKNLGSDAILIYGLIQGRGYSSLRLDFSESLKGQAVEQYILPFGQGLAGRIAEQGQMFFSPGLDEALIEPELAGVAAGKVCYGYPLKTRDYLHSVLVFLFPADLPQPEKPLLDVIANMISNYIGGVQPRRDLFRTRKNFSLLNNYKKIVSKNPDLRSVLSVFMNITASALSAEVGIFVLFKEGTTTPELEINWGISLQDLLKMQDGEGQDLIARVISNHEIVYIAQYGTENTPGRRIDSLLAGSLSVQSRAMGVLLFANKSRSVDGFEQPHFTDEDAELFDFMRDQVANSVENYVLYRKSIEIKNFNENVLESIQSGVVSIDLLGNILTANRRALELCGKTGDQVGQHIGKMFELKFFSPANLGQIIESGHFSPDISELEYDSADGTLVLGVLLSPLLDERSRPMGVVVTIDDMTERRMLERRMARTEQLAALGELSAGLAHELRNPLTAMKGFAQLLPRRLSDKAFLEKFSLVISNEITRLNDLVERLLVFARPGGGVFQKVAIRKIIDDTILLLRYQLEKAKVQTEIDDDAPLLVRCNPARLSQVFLNIMLNAIQAMQGGGMIRIRIRESEAILPPGERARVARLEFEDTGTGIAKKELNRIFNPFYTTKENGTGLGLAISFRIVEEHGGILEVESTENKGTNIRVFLPLLEGGAM